MRDHNSDLRALIDRSTTHFQAIVDLNSSRLMSAHALVRFMNTDGAGAGSDCIIQRIEEDLNHLEALACRLFCAIAGKVGPLTSRVCFTRLQMRAG